MNTKHDWLKDDGLYFVPLGGSEQFGMNLNVYACDGKLLAIDCGLGFADERYPGIDLLLPDPQILDDHSDRLEGMIITHAHEDHIGAVARLWHRFQCPLYGTAFTLEILRRKFKEAGIKRAKMIEIEPLKDIKIGPFTVYGVSVSHSIPDAISLFIKTKYGQVLHSGDWNLDPKPVVGQATSAAEFKAASKDGVLAYIGDSTNAEVGGFAGSEADVQVGLEAEFRQCDGRIAITIFSSNIGRVLSILKAAEKCGRQVCVIGRSLHNMVGAAKLCGYMDDAADFLSEEEIGFLPDDKVVMIMTGSQGEYRSALARISRGDHRNVSLNRGDTVIFSSREIPGNERHINAVKNNLSAGGIRIITPRDTENVIHVSGHPCQEEIALMLNWVKPKAVIPVHGERTQLDAHARFAKACQVSQTIVPQNGSVIKIAPDTIEIIGHVETGVLAVDQKRVIDVEHGSIRDRRKLQYTGVVHITIVLDKNGDMPADPKIDTYGLIDRKDESEKDVLDKIYDEVIGLLDELDDNEIKDDHFVQEELRIGLRRYVYHLLGIKPKTTVHLIRV